MFLSISVFAAGPMQERVDNQYKDKCEERRKHLEKELEDNPDSEYIQFLLEQLKERCKTEA